MKNSKTHNGYYANRYGLIRVCSLPYETIKRLLNKNFVPLVSCKEALLTTNLIHSIYASCEDNTIVSQKGTNYCY